jgi:glycosyltransferase involved in cell wall biosynthesis
VNHSDSASVLDAKPRGMPFRLSLVVPLFNEEPMLESFFERVLPVVEQATLDYELVCVNDGSSDGSLQTLLKRACPGNPALVDARVEYSQRGGPAEPAL